MLSLSVQFLCSYNGVALPVAEVVEHLEQNKGGTLKWERRLFQGLGEVFPRPCESIPP